MLEIKLSHKQGIIPPENNTVSKTCQNIKNVVCIEKEKRDCFLNAPEVVDINQIKQQKLSPTYKLFYNRIKFMNNLLLALGLSDNLS
jgi:hypothetical protein